MTLTVLSSLPETRRVASREKASALTAPRCPCNSSDLLSTLIDLLSAQIDLLSALIDSIGAHNNLTAPRCPCATPGHQWESQNATFRCVVLNECAFPEESQPFVLSTSAMNPQSAFPRPRRIKLIMRLVTAIPVVPL